MGEEEEAEAEAEELPEEAEEMELEVEEVAQLEEENLLFQVQELFPPASSDAQVRLSMK